MSELCVLVFDDGRGKRVVERFRVVTAAPLVIREQCVLCFVFSVGTYPCSSRRHIKIERTWLPLLLYSALSYLRR